MNIVRYALKISRNIQKHPTEICPFLKKPLGIHNVF